MADRPITFETRTTEAHFEMRDDATTGAPILEGYAATYNQPYDLGPFVEQIDPTAFKRTIASGPDVRLLIDHEGQPLARTKSGTLKLSPDNSTGLHVLATLDPSDPDVQRLLPKMRRGDLDQMSFAFRVPPGGDTWEKDHTLRTIREANLAGGDVSVVTYPANANTSVSVRAKDLLEANCVFAEAMVHEFRMGKTISGSNMSKLQSILAELATIDSHLDAADVGIDNAMRTLAEDLGVPNPDPVDPPEPQANSGYSLDLVKRRLALLDL